MEISRFVCFDVETPNRFNSRMSAIGITVIENGKIISEYYSLVNPEQRFDYFNVKLTGISSRMVKNEKTFPEIWEEIHDQLAQFGFILRYPEGSEGVTGHPYEPWHIRYVGEKAAEEITRQEITLEEYLNADDL